VSNVEVTIDRLKQEVLPELFATPARISQYAEVQRSSQSIEQLSNLMESGSASALADLIAEILSRMKDASPERIARKPTWIEKLLGADVEKLVRYQTAKATLEQLLAEAQSLADKVRETVQTLDQMIDAHADQAQSLQMYIRAGREFLDENPQAGEHDGDGVQFDRPRERFERKLANLLTLLTSHELSVNQMKLSRAQAVDLLDRFQETVTVLVPVWRQHALALLTTKHMSPAMIAAASKAHQDLLASLADSLNSIRH